MGKRQSRTIKNKKARVEEENWADDPNNPDGAASSAMMSDQEAIELARAGTWPSEKLDDDIPPWLGGDGPLAGDPDHEPSPELNRVIAAAVDKAETPRKDEHRVTVIQDNLLEYPQMFINVMILGPDNDAAGFPTMFARASCQKAETFEDADLVVFTGGVDVDPRLYGEKPHPTTSWCEDRDNEEIAAYLKCVEQGIPMLGVCRGAQFLHVMNGGKLFQDIDGHNSRHSILDHKTKETIHSVSSVHHQAVRPHKGMTIIATVAKSSERWLNDKSVQKGTYNDIEAFAYRDTCCLGIQGHPEYYGYNRFTIWTLNQINEHVLLNPDVEWHNTVRRVKPELLAERQFRLSAKAEPKPTAN